MQSGVQGNLAHCWLKNSVPKPVRDKCCVSGLPVRAHGCEIGGVVRMDVLDRDCQEAQTTGCIKRLLSKSAYAACLRAQPVVSSGCLIGGVTRKAHMLREMLVGLPVRAHRCEICCAVRMVVLDRDCQEDQTMGCIKRLLSEFAYAACLRAQPVVSSGCLIGGVTRKDIADRTQTIIFPIPPSYTSFVMPSNL